MNIALVHPSLAVKGGAESIVVWLAWGLRQRGHRVTVFTADYNEALWPGGYLDGVEVEHVDARAHFLNSSRLALYRTAYRLRRRLAAFDLVNCHNWPANLWVGLAKAMSLRFPRVVWYCQEPNRNIYWEKTDRHLLEHCRRADESPCNAHLREDVERERRDATATERRHRKRSRAIRWDQAAARRMDLALVNSRFSKETYEAVYGASPLICHLGIPLGGPGASPGPGTEPAGPRGNYLCAVSPLTRKKNVHNVIEAMDILVHRWKRADVRLRVAGEGPERGSLEALVAARGLRGSVEVLGPVPDGELPCLYRGARLAVYVPIDEPFGLVPLEAMSHGTPVVASDHGGILDTVVHGETGLHVNPFDPEAIARAIQDLYDDEPRRQAMGAAGARRVRELFTLEQFLDRFEAAALGPPATGSRGFLDRLPAAPSVPKSGSPPEEPTRRLNLGCGIDIRPGYVNLDKVKLPGVDVVHDLERPPYPFPDAAFDEIVARDVLEHLRDTVKVMEELWRILRPGGILRVRVPHGRSMNFLHDPTHVSAFTEETFGYFAPSGGPGVPSRYGHYSTARFEILELRCDYKEMAFLRSKRLFRLLFGREVRLDYGNIHCVLRKLPARPEADPAGAQP